jgi:hypothetical protein
MLGLRGWTDGYVEVDQAARWVRLVATALAVLAVLVVAWGAWTMLRAALDLISRREVEGQVIRRRTYSRGNNRTDHFMAVDPGRSDRVRAWMVPAAVYRRFREGAVVGATLGPRLGHVFRIELAGEGRGATPTLESPPAAGPDRAAAAQAGLASSAGAASDPPAGAADLDPAELVAAEDAAAALGQAVGPARQVFQPPLPVGRMRGCQYRAISGRGTVSVFTAAGELAGFLARVNRHFGATVGGVGAEAVLRGDTVAVVRGDVAVIIRLQGDQVADRPAALRQLAAIAADRLASLSDPPPDGDPAGPRGAPTPRGQASGST